MRIFVVGTGRCGTTTFYHACTHIMNYTAAHETEICKIPTYEFPDNHIEVSCLNSIALPLLKDKYPDCFIVHLKRSREKTIYSWVKEGPDQIAAWARMWCLQPKTQEVNIRAAAELYYDSTVALCRIFCDSEVELSSKLDFSRFWAAIKAQGDFVAAWDEFSRFYNASGFRGRDNYAR